MALYRYILPVMLPWIALPAAIAGWNLGWLSAWFTDWVQPAEDATPIRWRSGLVRDPLVQAGVAIIWIAIPFFLGGSVLRWLEAGLLAVPLIQVGVTDLRTRYVYTVVAVIGLGFGLLMGWHYHGVDWYWSVVGALGGGLVFGVLYGLGRLIYRGGEPMARGDITIAAMVGAGAASCVLTALAYGVLASGLIALGVLAVTRSRHVYMPYGPGLCLGGLATLFLC
jgi:prepilin signal peptidase PulO-like enzyme (type II secretory pathway)